MKHEDITERVIGAFFAVYNALGWGFLEKVYQGAMEVELRKRGLSIIPQAKIEVFYEGSPSESTSPTSWSRGASSSSSSRSSGSRGNTRHRSSTT